MLKSAIRPFKCAQLHVKPWSNGSTMVGYYMWSRAWAMAARLWWMDAECKLWHESVLRLSGRSADTAQKEVAQGGAEVEQRGVTTYVVFSVVVIVIQSLFTGASPVSRSSRLTEMPSNLSLPRLLCLREKKFNQEETRLRKNTAIPPLRTCRAAAALWALLAAVNACCLQRSECSIGTARMHACTLPLAGCMGWSVQDRRLYVSVGGRCVFTQWGAPPNPLSRRACTPEYWLNMYSLPHICGSDHGRNVGARNADRRNKFQILFFDLPFEGLVACASRSTPSGRYINECSTTWLKKNCNIPQVSGRDPGRTELQCGQWMEIWESGNLGLCMCCVIRLYSQAEQTVLVFCALGVCWFSSVVLAWFSSNALVVCIRVHQLLDPWITLFERTGGLPSFNRSFQKSCAVPSNPSKPSAFTYSKSSNPPKPSPFSPRILHAKSLHFLQVLESSKAKPPSPRILQSQVPSLAPSSRIKPRQVSPSLPQVLEQPKAQAQAQAQAKALHFPKSSSKPKPKHKAKALYFPKSSSKPKPKPKLKPKPKPKPKPKSSSKPMLKPKPKSSSKPKPKSSNPTKPIPFPNPKQLPFNQPTSFPLLQPGVLIKTNVLEHYEE